MSKIRILIADDSRELCDILETFLEMTEHLTCCGKAHNGRETLEVINRLLPDVVILDVIMPNFDGISVLESLQENPPAKQPLIIITSAIGQDQIIRKAMHLGASYYMIKPYGLRELQSRIELIASPLIEESESPSDDLRARVTSLIRSLGVPTKVLGYHYMIDAVMLLINDEKLLAKQVYATLAKSNNTSVDSVESAIRKTIERIFACPNHILVEKFGTSRRPSNALFLTVVAEDIKQQRRPVNVVAAGREKHR